MERRPYVIGTIVGAAVGGALGYLWYARGDRLTLDGARHVIDRVSGELQFAQTLWHKVRSALADYQYDRRRAAGYGVFEVVDLEAKTGSR